MTALLYFYPLFSVIILPFFLLLKYGITHSDVLRSLHPPMDFMQIELHKAALEYFKFE